MPRRLAKKHFSEEKNTLRKLLSIDAYKNRMNKLFEKLDATFRFNITNKFRMSDYGGERQWIRCLIGLI